MLFSFCNHESYSIKNIYVYSKSKIKTKVTSKQNLEHFKMTNRTLFVYKFCNNSKMLLSSSWAIFIRALVFSSSPRANFSSFEYLYFSFMLSIMLYYLFWYNKTQSRSFLIQLETTMPRLRKFEQKIICDENFEEKYWKGFCFCRDLNFPKFSKWRVWNKNVMGGNFSGN